jgi:hypothetical protein
VHGDVGSLGYRAVSGRVVQGVRSDAAPCEIRGTLRCHCRSNSQSKDPPTFLSEAHRINASVALCAAPLEPSVSNKPLDQVSDARSITAGCGHNLSLAGATPLSYDREDHELRQREPESGLAREYPVGALSSTMQKLQDGQRLS